MTAHRIPFTPVTEGKDEETSRAALQFGGSTDEDTASVGQYIPDYSPLTREELDSVDSEIEALLARSIVVSERKDS